MLRFDLTEVDRVARTPKPGTLTRTLEGNESSGAVRLLFDDLLRLIGVFIPINLVCADLDGLDDFSSKRFLAELGTNEARTFVLGLLDPSLFELPNEALVDKLSAELFALYFAIRH